MAWPLRDRFFLDPGHMSPMLYGILTLTGNYSLEELSNFRQWGSPTPGHPEVDAQQGGGEYLRSAGTGSYHGRGSCHSRTFPGSPFW